MKRLFLPVLVLLIVTLACSTQASPPAPASEPPTPAQQTTAPLPAEPSPTSSATPPPGEPCANPLYPLVTGHQWIYQVSSKDAEPGRVGLTVEKIEASKATINALDMTTGVITQTIAECEGTAITNYPSMTLGMLLSGYLEGEIETEHISGVFAPTYEDLAASNWALAWDGEYVAQGVLLAQAEGEQVTITMNDSPLQLHWISGENGTPVYETVTVPAGVFENALKVTREMEIEASLVTSLGNFRGTLRVTTSHWFLPYTGLLKAKVESGDLVYMGMTFPITLSGEVELVEFRP